jgi:hypothetical protein
MNARHSAALALVGWYLMLPPNGLIQADLSVWTITSHFKTETSCDVQMKKLNAEGKAAAIYYSEQIQRLTPVQQLMQDNVAFAKERAAISQRFARCVSAEDPRLKSN